MQLGQSVVASPIPGAPVVGNGADTGAGGKMVGLVATGAGVGITGATGGGVYPRAAAMAPVPAR